MKIPFISDRKQKKAETVNFFKLSSQDKKKVITKAVRESTDEQIRIMKEHGFAFASIKND